MFLLRVVIFLTFALFVFTAHVFAERGRYRDALLKKYAPVWVQSIGRYPSYDAVTKFDFDGNIDGRDNQDNVTSFPLQATVYGEISAETTDSYYIFYGIYHPRDYDKPLREWAIKGAAHENDFEGAMLNVSKQTGKIRGVETWFHNIFLQCFHSAISNGDQTIDARINAEDDTHPILYVQSGGHGVRCFQKMDEERILDGSHKIYRISDSSDDIKKTEGLFIRYKLASFDVFIKNATGPFTETSMFVEPADFGFRGKLLGKYISGKLKGDSGWARPKPPWSWADKRDSLRYGSWYLHPAFVFNRHFGYALSTVYINERGLRKRLNIYQTELNEWIKEERQGSFMKGLEKGALHNICNGIRKFIYRIMDPIFFYFG